MGQRLSTEHGRFARLLVSISPTPSAAPVAQSSASSLPLAIGARLEDELLSGCLSSQLARSAARVPTDEVNRYLTQFYPRALNATRGTMETLTSYLAAPVRTDNSPCGS